MTVHARRSGSPLPGNATRLVSPVAAILCLAISTAAHGQVGVTASVYNDYRLRGVSVSGGRPVGIVDLSYDLPNGVYAALSGRLVATSSEGPQYLGFAADAGYAARLASNLTADVGIVHSAYSDYSRVGGRRAYSEVYAGLSGKLVSGRISVSPDYLGRTGGTAYVELDGHYDLSRVTMVEGGIGALIQLGAQYHANDPPQLDGHIGVSHRLGPLQLHAALVARNGAYRYAARPGGRAALIVGISAAL